MKNEKDQQAQEALKTLNLIKKCLKIIAYLIMLGAFVACSVVIYQQENYIEQLNNKITELNQELNDQEQKIIELQTKINK